MNVLHDPEFVITTITAIVICVVSSVITICVARRIPVELPLGYETLKIEEIRGEENVKAIKSKMQMLLDNDNTSNTFCLFTFRIWNDGRKPIQLSNSTPLIIRFRQGVKILGWERLECEPDYVKASPTIAEREVKLDLPFLDSKHSITMYLLLNEYVDYFPDVYSEVHHNGRNKFTKANNIRSSRENKIAGIIAICIGAYSLISYNTSFNGPIDALINVNLVLGAYLIIGVGLLYMSYVERRSVPHNFLLSRILKNITKPALSVLPYIIVIVGIGIAVYSFLGKRVFIDCIITLTIAFLLPAMLWLFIHSFLNWLFKKMTVKCNPLLTIVFAGIFPIVVFVWFLPLVVFAWTNS